MRFPAGLWAAKRVAGEGASFFEAWTAVSGAFFLIGLSGMEGRIPIDLDALRPQLGWFGEHFAYWSVCVFVGSVGIFALYPMAIYLRLHNSSIGKPDAED